MKVSKIALIKLALLACLSFHLIIHLLYLAPANPATSQYSELTNKYMSTFFTQNWHLFAPEPATSSLKISYRCSTRKEWHHPLQELLFTHKKFPLTAKGKQSYVLQHIAREIFNGKLKQKSDDQITELSILQRYIQDVCGKYSNAEVQIQRTFTTAYSKRFESKEGQNQVYKFILHREVLAWN